LLARILGVSRATVSEAVNAFERRGLLERLRGLIRIRDRDGLERSACRCYRITRQEGEPQKKRGKLFALPVFWALLEIELVAI
ncbi:MAG: winged helix-turn-helix domain-containing protein, partial [Acidobacteria bacterium]|nr:winged helix-turn-helix domain-containing protein [Acidobacteriota bacterium]